MTELSCQELVELVTEYLDGVLTPEDRARFDEHIADCPGCDMYLAQFRSTIRLTAATGDLEGRPEVTGLLEAFKTWNKRV